jgi:L-threonylcarbamoyladenylate synthase
LVNTRVLPISVDQFDSSAIRLAASVLRAGGLVAFPTETVYGLGANALDATAVSSIFAAKERPASDPIIVHIDQVDELATVATDVPLLAYELAARFWPGPLTLVLRRSERVPPVVSAGMATVAVRMPAHPIARALIRQAGVPVAAPSANRFARPSSTTAAHVLEDLNGRVDVILDGGPATIGLESTVLDLTRAAPTVLRPGAVTLEMLQVVIPEVQIIARYLQPDQEGMEAPGMLLKHYSPRAELRLYAGETQHVIAAMRQSARDLAAGGRRVGLLVPDDEHDVFSDLPVELRLLGTDLETISHHLFDRMRALDRDGVDVILMHGVEQTGLGLALWDRLVRAANGQVIWCTASDSQG